MIDYICECYECIHNEAWHCIRGEKALNGNGECIDKEIRGIK